MHISFQHVLEIPAVICGILNITLAARANIWNWFFGAIMVSLYMIIFFQTKLYADMVLQIVFLTLQFYGWYQWLYGNAAHTALPVRTTPRRFYPWLILSVIILFFILSYLLSRYTDSTTVTIDAFTTAASLVAQWMMCKKLLENWWVWMLVDIISIKMYLFKDLYMTGGLYAVFFIICCQGYWVWRSQMVALKSNIQ